LKKLYPYLLLNIAVSALTMLLVLFIWDKTHPTPNMLLAQDQPSQNPIITSTPTFSLPPLDAPVIEIQAVIVPGDLEAERVLIRSVSTSTLNLTGWKVDNGSGQAYTFPSLTLYPGGVIALYSKSGENTAIDVFWGLSRAAWKSGGVVMVTDSAGGKRVEYVIP
jgi:hypothetical protein